jgi:CheY-like chemotaxis protein
MTTDLRGKILWADDEIELLRSHVLYLRERGIEVFEVTNGQDAIDAVQEDRYDLVLMDQMMPGMDGIATLREIKTYIRLYRWCSSPRMRKSGLWMKPSLKRCQDISPNRSIPAKYSSPARKCLRKRQILGDKATSGYLHDFQEIEAALSTDLDADGWWQLYRKLIQWQLEMDDRKDVGLKPILEEQMANCNMVFTQFITDHYLDWIQTKAAERPTLSTDVVESFVSPHLKDGQKIFLLVIDCLRSDQALTILPEIQRYFDVDVDYHISLIPSATPYSRNGIFSGLTLDEIQNKHPSQWAAMKGDEHSMNREEQTLLRKHLDGLGFRDRSIHYSKVNVAREGKGFLGKLGDIMEIDVISLVVNFMDLLTHHRSHSDLLLEMLPDDAGYRSMVKTWFSNSWLLEVLQMLSESDYRVILTTDHGSIRVKKPVRVAGDRETSSGIRYKYGRNLNCPDKHALVIKDPAKYRLPEMVKGTNYLIAKEDRYFVYPTEYHKYRETLDGSFQHGGISMEEMLVPVLTLTPRP